jgi:hypothetical protein
MNRKRDSSVPANRSTSLDVVTADEVILGILKAVALKERLGLEYDKIMIIAVVACRHAAQSEGRERGNLAAAPEQSLLAWNGSTMSLARYLGIPRASVRRKLAELRDDGWLMQDGESGRYRPSEHLLRALGDLTPGTRLSV